MKPTAWLSLAWLGRSGAAKDCQTKQAPRTPLQFGFGSPKKLKRPPVQSLLGVTLPLPELTVIAYGKAKIELGTAGPAAPRGGRSSWPLIRLIRERLKRTRSCFLSTAVRIIPDAVASMASRPTRERRAPDRAA